MIVTLTLKSYQQLKFLKFVVDYELRHLHTHGIGGISVRVCGISMDLRGREKFFNQRGCNSSTGCSVCTMRFFNRVAKKVHFCGSRRWLPTSSPLRGAFHNGFDFVDEERRRPPSLRTTASVFDACALIEEVGADLNDYIGQRGPPMFHSLPNCTYEQQV